MTGQSRDRSRGWSPTRTSSSPGARGRSGDAGKWRQPGRGPPQGSSPVSEGRPAAPAIGNRDSVHHWRSYGPGALPTPLEGAGRPLDAALDAGGGAPEAPSAADVDERIDRILGEEG